MIFAPRIPRRILVIRRDRIGDVVVSTAVFRALREAFPDVYLAAMVRPATEPVLRHNPRLDAILVDDSEGAHAGRAGFLDRVRMLRSHRFDTALMLLPSSRHAWMTFAAGIPRRIGVGIRLDQILTFARPSARRRYVPLRHEADYCLDLARSIGVETTDVRSEVFVTEEEIARARAELDAVGRDRGCPLMVVHVESGRSAPNWPVQEYVEFVRQFLQACPNAQVLVVLTPSAASLRPGFAGLDRQRVLVPEPQQDLRRLMAWIAQADLSVSASTGPMHLAAGLRVPSVNLFCPLPACSPDRWGPRGNNSTIVLPPDAYCQDRCPGDPKLCTFAGGIGVARMLAAVRAMLETLPPRTQEGPPASAHWQGHSPPSH